MAGATEGDDDSTWLKLRRRKVVQWGLAYCAAAWGFLQGLEYVTDTFHWPDRIQQIATLALLIGLPVVLVLAWYHGDRGTQRVTRAEVAIVTLLILLGGGAFWAYQRTSAVPEVPTVAQTVPAPAPPVASDRSIAVMPFLNMSPDKDQEYFADGISEELLNLLARVPELRVIARTSSFSFKGSNADIAEIARRLHVSHVLEGSVRTSSDTLRVTAQLVRTSDSSHLWSQTYDRRLTDVFAVQDDIAAAVVEQLKVRLLGAAPKLRETDPKAYALFLEARSSAQLFTQESMRRSIALYEQALDIDSDYAPAWDGLAQGYYSLADFDMMAGEDVLPPARDAVRRALEIDPDYAPAYARAALIDGALRGDLAAAARHLERGLALDPSNVDLAGVAIKIARRLNRLDLALGLSEYVVARDPVNSFGYEQLAISYANVGRFDDAVRACRAGLDLNPEAATLHGLAGDALMGKGEAAAALAEYELEPMESFRLSGFYLANGMLGKEGKSRAALDQLTSKFGRTSPYYIASALGFRGEIDRAFEWLEKAVELRSTTVGVIASDPWLESLHSDPRWVPLLRRVGSAPEQLAAIRFDIKVPE